MFTKLVSTPKKFILPTLENRHKILFVPHKTTRIMFKKSTMMATTTRDDDGVGGPSSNVVTTTTTAAGGGPSSNFLTTTTTAAAPEEAGGQEDVMMAAATIDTMTSRDDHDGVGGPSSNVVTTKTTAAGGGPSYNVVTTTTTTAAAAPEEAGGGEDVTTVAAPMTTTTTTRDDDDIDHCVVGGRGRISKALMSDDDLFEYFKLRLGGGTVCPNEGCLCLSMLRNPGACAAVAKYLVRFERLSKHAQDSIIFEWVKYATQIGKSTGKYHCYHGPFDCDVIKDDQEILEYVRACKLCVTGMKFVMGIRAWRFRTIRRAVRCTSIMPAHKGKGKVSNNGIKCDDLRMQALTHHYEYLLNLGEVRATRVVATLVDGVQGHGCVAEGDGIFLHGEFYFPL